MRCTACGGELILTNVAQDDVPGVEHHTFICPECHVTERRVLLMRHGREDESAPMPPGKPGTPASGAQEEHRAAGLFGRLIARIRGH